MANHMKQPVFAFLFVRLPVVPYEAFVLSLFILHSFFLKCLGTAVFCISCVFLYFGRHTVISSYIIINSEVSHDKF